MWLVQLFYHTNTLRIFPRCLWYAVNEKLAVFLLYLASSITFGNQEGQHIRPIRNQEKVKKTGSDWLANFGKRQVKIINQLSSTIAVFLGKCELVSIFCGSHKNFKPHYNEESSFFTKSSVTCPNLGLLIHNVKANHIWKEGTFKLINDLHEIISTELHIFKNIFARTESTFSWRI